MRTKEISMRNLQLMLLFSALQVRFAGSCAGSVATECSRQFHLRVQLIHGRISVDGPR